MAVGGIPDLSWEQIGSNIQEQNDEILALQAVFEGEEERVKVLSTASETEINLEEESDEVSGNMLQLFVPVRNEGGKISLDVYQPWTDSETAQLADKGVTYTRSDSGQRLIWSFEVSSLSPLCLHVTLPTTYPSMDPPAFVISCSWLSPSQLTAVCQELDRLWIENISEDGAGMPILYTWFDWLQETTLRFLGLDSQIPLTTHKLDDDVDDCRVVVETEDIDEIVTCMIRYNQQEEMKEFSKMDHECGICFDIQNGSRFVMIPECKHAVCVTCMKEHCKILVKDGSVLSIRCPYYECKSSIPPYILQKVLPEDQFQRFETLALQKCLNVMDDVVWCPRCSTAVIREPEEDLNLAHCVSCFYSFCAECGEKWHQREPCAADMEALAKKKEQLKKKIIKDEVERLEAIRKARQYEEEGMSTTYIYNNVKRCPGCRAKIMKIGGCNKVACSVCHAYMCWICCETIDGYDHFRDSSRCNTFSMGETFDNTDIKQPNFIAEPVRQPIHNPPVLESRIIRNMLKANPELAKDLLACVSCKQKNLKTGNNNHIHCYNCKASLCFDCKGKIVGPVGRHFSGVNSCRQHS